jgi:oligopeptide transport system substrate-binding protein
MARRGWILEHYLNWRQTVAALAPHEVLSTLFRPWHSALVVGLLSAVAACHPASPTNSTATLHRALAGEPSTLDPGAASDNFSTALLIDLYEGLTAEAPNGDVLPGVAESWSRDSSGTVYTFRLRRSARWSNGKPVLAMDFVNAWRREIDPKFASPTADDLRLIANAAEILAGKKPASDLGVLALTDSTLVVKLERPAPYFLQILAHPAMYPVYSDISARTHQPSAWVSNGPYTLKSWRPATEIDLTSNPYYWDESHVQIKSVTYSFISDDISQYARYRSGQIDLTDLVPSNALPTLRQEHPSELVISPFLATAYYGFNLSQQSLSSVALRKALAMAIDRKRLVESLGFGQVGAYSFVPPGTANYTQQSWDWKDLPDEERVATAKHLYLLAGFSDKNPLTLRVLFNSNEVIQRTAVLIASMWKDNLGVDVELTAEEFRVFLQSRHDRFRWDVARLAWTADFNDASNFLDVLRGNSPNNDMGYGNPRVDAALNRAELLTDPSQRREALQMAESMMLKDYPIIPLYYFVSKRLVKPYVRGVMPNSLNHLPSKGLTIER